MLPHNQAGESFYEEAGTARRADGEPLRILPDGHPDQGHPLPELHVAIELGSAAAGKEFGAKQR
jgi:hypothetical protein